MTAEQIDARLAVLQEMQAKERDPSTLATLARCIEKLVMMDPDEDADE